MKKIIIVNGLIAGVIVTLWMIAGMFGFVMQTHSVLIGYTTMLVAFSFIFIGVKNYRDKQNGGLISFGKAFQIGILITIIASTIYVGVWLIYFNYFDPDFLEKYTSQTIAKMKANQAGTVEIKKQTDQLKAYAALYKNWFYNALFTYAEILPVGLIVTVTCALILKRKNISESSSN